MKNAAVGLRWLFDVRDLSRMWVTGWKGEAGGKERVGDAGAGGGGALNSIECNARYAFGPEAV